VPNVLETFAPVTVCATAQLATAALRREHGITLIDSHTVSRSKIIIALSYRFALSTKTTPILTNSLRVSFGVLVAFRAVSLHRIMLTRRHVNSPRAHMAGKGQVRTNIQSP
jgi:hypothetical protein